ncbi:hypothetical protein A2U01_0024695 [Trifolium medium]|uniref:Uncharacterized protein n=1 Tax=Trifolium medium TaxID=97028 RepID=A0A392NYS4_9FABA|nr:hypothetical protein [Trifolium medium]
MSPIEDQVLSIDPSPTIQPNASASAENDLSASAQKTPGKRSAGKPVSNDQANLDSQFSSTRSGKLIKKEKI